MYAVAGDTPASLDKRRPKGYAFLFGPVSTDAAEASFRSVP
jgi:hypothetical protein